MSVTINNVMEAAIVLLPQIVVAKCHGEISLQTGKERGDNGKKKKCVKNQEGKVN